MCAKRTLAISPFNERYLFKNQRPENPVFYINATGIVYPDNRYRFNHFKKHYSFQYILKGKGDISFNGKKRKVGAGDLLYMSSWDGISYSADSAEPYTKIWFNGFGRFFSGMEQIFGINTPYCVAHISEEQNVTELFHKIFDELVRENADETILMELVLHIFKILCEAENLPAVRASETEKPPEKKKHSFSTASTATEIRHYIDMNLFEKKLLKNCAARFGISERTLYSHFKAAFGVAPHSYISEKKLESAREMILSEKLSVAKIAEKAGFCSAAYFNECFKTKYGMPPQKYKDSLLQNEQPQIPRKDNTKK